MKTYSVRDFHSVSQMSGGKTYSDLPVAFEGTLAECHFYCEKERNYKWHHSDEMLFGGYYVDNEGKCLMIV